MSLVSLPKNLTYFAKRKTVSYLSVVDVMCASRIHIHSHPLGLSGRQGVLLWDGASKEEERDF